LQLTKKQKKAKAKEAKKKFKEKNKANQKIFSKYKVKGFITLQYTKRFVLR
jgi:hypothetical protein